MAIITRSMSIESNYLTLRNTGSDTLVINTITPFAGIWEGFLLHVEWDDTTKGEGMFLKNKTAADTVGNIRLEARAVAGVSGEISMTSKITTNAGTLAAKHVIGHIVDALAAISAASPTARDAAISAAVAALTTTTHEPQIDIREGAFAYGLGGTAFISGFGRKNTFSGVDYYDYSYRHPYLVLMWNGTEWQQVSLSVNSFS